MGTVGLASFGITFGLGPAVAIQSPVGQPRTSTSALDESSETPEVLGYDLVAEASAQQVATSLGGGETEGLTEGEYAAEVEAFWTDERLDSAEPDDGWQVENDYVYDIRTPSVPTAPQAPPVQAVLAEDAAAREQQIFNAPTGRYFFRNPDGEMKWCTASVVNTPSKRIAITAGHCVHTGKDGDWMRRGIFFPAYRDGVKPFGGYAIRYFYTFKDWTDFGGPELNPRTSINFQRDIGVLVLTLGGRTHKRVQDVTGAHGLKYNMEDNEWMADVFGYPGNISSGRVRQRCTRGTFAGHHLRLEVLCNFKGGASGGPWIYDINSAGLGYIRGVTSVAWKDPFEFGADAIATPRLDEAVWNLVSGASDRWQR